jgi:hypothetical protein
MMAKLTENRPRINVEVAHKFYEAQTLLKRLWGEEYSSKIERWIDGLQHGADLRCGGDVLKAALPIVTGLDKEGNGMGMLCILAGCVELIEGGSA